MEIKEKIIDEEIVGKYFKQNCGDTLLVLNECIVAKNREKKFKCQFQNHPCEVFASKYNIKNKKVNNPQIEIDEFLGHEFLQRCGDILVPLERLKEKNKFNRYVWRCRFKSNNYEIISTKDNVIEGVIGNPYFKRKVIDEIVGKYFKQNCGDTLLVIRKIEEKDKGGNFLYECEFQKYPYKIKAIKRRILDKNLLNPQIEVEEFINKLWPQNCGDILKVLRRTEEKGRDGKFLFECEFQKYHYIVKAIKYDIIKGYIVNPQIEIEEFINKTWPQHCGDTLKILKKIEERDKGEHILYECEFLKYPCIVKANKSDIKRGYVLNPRIEEEEFINKLWPQNNGDILRILRKTEEREIYSNGKKGAILFEGEFLKYPCKIKASKDNTLKGEVDNPNLPWKSEENLEKYIKEKFFDKKPTLIELKKLIYKEFNLKPGISLYINKFNLRDLIKYYSVNEQNTLKEYIKSIYNGEITTYNGKKEDNYYEIDVYLPDLKIGFEYNGSYWHNLREKRKPGYHKEKEELFAKKGIRIYYIWDYEWFEDKDHIIISESCKEKVRNIIFN